MAGTDCTELLKLTDTAFLCSLEYDPDSWLRNRMCQSEGVVVIGMISIPKRAATLAARTHEHLSDMQDSRSDILYMTYWHITLPRVEKVHLVNCRSGFSSGAHFCHGLFCEDLLNFRGPVGRVDHVQFIRRSGMYWGCKGVAISKWILRWRTNYHGRKCGARLAKWSRIGRLLCGFDHDVPQSSAYI